MTTLCDAIDAAVAPTLIGRRRIVAEQIDALEQTGAYPPGGLLVAGEPYAAAALRRILPDLPHGYLDEVQRQVNALEDAQYRAARLALAATPAVGGPWRVGRTRPGLWGRR